MKFCHLLVATLISLLCCQSYQVAEGFQCTACNATKLGCKCKCDVDKKSITCMKKKLKSIPIEEIPSDVEQLDLSNNQLVNLSDLANFTKLTHLNLNHNKISSWEPTWLMGLLSVVKLQLSQNQLEEPPTELCDLLPSLQRLYLDNNKLNASFPENYSKCNKLSRLTLSNNPFAAIDNETLCSLGAGKGSAQLSLKLNRLHELRSVQPGALACLSTRLTSLDIGQNSLTQAGFEGLVGASNLSHLQTLGLKMSTGLQAVTKSLLAGLTTLRTLSLDGSTSLTELAADAFAQTPKLTRLSLSRTRVAYWSSGSLDLLTLLHELDLRNTSVSTIGGLNGSDANPLPQLAASMKFANLSLLGTQLTCDCSIFWLSRQLQNPTVFAKLHDAELLTCAHPAEALGRRLVEFAPSHCDGQAPSEFFTVQMIIILASTAGGLLAMAIGLTLFFYYRRRRLRAANASSDMEDPLVGPTQFPRDDATSTTSAGRQESGWICLELRRFVRQSRETMAHRDEHRRVPIFSQDHRDPESYLEQDHTNSA